MKKIFLLLTLFNFSFLAFSQDFSNKGKEFWIAYPSHIDGTNSVMGIYITANVNTTATVVVGPTTTLNVNITANQVTRVFLGTGAGNNATNTGVYLNMSDGIKVNAAVKVTSQLPVVVYAHIIRSARSAATLVLPTPVLGTEYLLPSYQSTSTSSGVGNGSPGGIGEFVVIATQANTIIEINPSVAGRGGKPAGVPYQITLDNPGDCYQFQSNNLADISGTTIKSVSSGSGGCKPIAVFSATTWSTFNCSGSSGGDNLLQQVFPNRSWGKSFVTAPFINRNTTIYRVYVQDVTTNVSNIINGTTTNLPTSSLNTVGKFYEFSSPSPVLINADKPIMVTQYISSQTCNTGCNTGSNNQTCFADPEMVILNPVEQTLSDVTFFSAHQNYVPSGQTQVVLHFVNIIISKNFKNSVRIDGNIPIGSFVDIPNSNYSYLRENITASSATNPVHRVIADTGFSAIVYGYGNVESYGYNGGTNVIDLYQYVTLQNQFASVNFPATCKGTPFKFSITLPYQPLSITWDFNNNTNLSPNTNIVNNTPAFDSSFVRDGKTLYVYKLSSFYTFSNQGTYPIKVIVNNPTSDGCSGLQEINYDVTVYNKPSANFSFTQTGCINDPINFTDLSNGNGRSITKWQWNFGDNTIDSVKNPVKTYTSASTGTYPVKLNAFTDIGCMADTTINLPISAKPNVKFGISDTTCAGKTIFFHDSSTVAVGTIVKWYWDYGNGNKDTLTSNAIPRSQTYTIANMYTASLMVETNTGCKSTLFTKTFMVHPNPVVDFALPIVCLPVGAATFTNNTTIADGSIALATYNWNFGDGGTSTSVNGVHNYSALGPFSVKLVAKSNNNCIAEKTQTLSTVYPAPTANFTVTAETCLRDSTTFTNTGNAGAGNTITNWYWNRDFGGVGVYTDTLSTFKYRYPSAKTYTVKMYFKTDKGCLSNTATKTLIINPLPTAQFINSNPLCEKRDILFTAQSVPNVGTINRWHWNMGNTVVNNFTNANPFNQAYTNWNNYTVKHMVETDKGCKSDTISKVLNIRPLPNIGFVLPEVCLSDAAAVFTDTTKIADNSQAGFTYNWTFNVANITPGPVPSTSTLKNGTTKYNKSDNYQVKLKVTSAAGCIDSLTKSFTVNGSIPDANFEVQTPTNLCSNIPVAIKNTSTVDFGDVTKVEIFWDYTNNPSAKDVDDNPSPNKIYNHLYPNFQQPASKTFTIRFLAYSGGTCVDIITKTVTVHASPKVQFVTMPGICFDANARQITQASEVGGVAGANPAFAYFGTGVNATGLFNPATAGVGTFPIKYVFTSNQGCKDSATRNITVWPSPTAKFGISSPVCEKNAITFTDSSVANFSNIVNWNYSFGDATTLTRNNANAFTKTYSTGNTYTATLRVTTDSGCVSTVFSRPIKVNYLPVVNFTLPEICLPDGRGTFTNTSTIPDNTDALFTYNWNFGDANNTTPSVLKNPTHQYSALAPTGGYQVKLKVTSNNGCVDSLTKSFNNVYPQPKAEFSMVPANGQVCVGDTIQFNDLSNGRTSAVNTWRWNLGNNVNSTVQNPFRQYNDSGTFQVRLFIFNAQGCVSDTITKSIIIHPYPKLNAGNDLFVLEGGIAQLKPIYFATNPIFNWSPATYLDSPNIANPRTKPLDDITYTVRLTGIGGCSVTDDIKITVLRAPIIPNAFSPNGDGINDTWEIKYLESYPGASIEVFDRGGRLVYNSINYPKNWDGTTNGKLLPVATYYYIINPKNGRKVMSGSVTILR